MLLDQSNVRQCYKPAEEQPTSEPIKIELSLNRIRRLSGNGFKSRWSKFLLVSLCLVGVYFLLHSKSSRNQISTSPAPAKIVQTHPDAFIITANCNSSRFNGTKENIERVFPNFFNIHCYKNTPLNDSRIHTSPVLLFKQFSSNQLAFIDLWTYIIPKKAAGDDLYWSFIFEDDVNFNDPAKVALTNFTGALLEMMFNPQVQLKDGFMYLGICGPKFDNDTSMLVSSDTNNTLVSQRSYGFCMHASGVTARKSLLLWAEISSYRPNAADSSLDLQMRDYSMRSGNHYYTFGSNFLYPPGTGHFGIAFQDRGRFSTTIA